MDQGRVLHQCVPLPYFFFKQSVWIEVDNHALIQTCTPACYQSVTMNVVVVSLLPNVSATSEMCLRDRSAQTVICCHTEIEVIGQTCFHPVTVKAVLNWAEHSVHEQLCLLEMFKLAVRFLASSCVQGPWAGARMFECSQHMIWEHASDWLNSFMMEEKKQKRG